MYKKLFLFLLLIPIYCNGQEVNSLGSLNGSLESTSNFFMRDSSIGASNTPQYDRQLFGLESWLSLNYNKGTFEAGIRYDLFNNSNLLNRLGSYSAQGIGRWFIRKKIDKLSLEGGYIYDVIGNGIIFRAFEERPLAIDNALYGIKAEYALAPNINIKAIAGKQKQQLAQYSSNIRGLTLDGYFANDSTGISIAPGIGIIARTNSDVTVNQLISTISTYSLLDSIPIQYNTYAFSFFNKLNYKNIGWNTEVAYKTKDIFFDADADKINANGEISKGKFVNKDGMVIYNNLIYSGTNISGSLEHKITKRFNFRADPFVENNQGLINYLPPMSRQNTYRLTSRYSVAPRELDENAIQLDINYNINDNISLNVNASKITSFGIEMYRELYNECSIKQDKNSWVIGLQLQKYNQRIYENKPEADYVNTITPFIEYQRNLTESKTLKIQSQYLNTKNDFGSWAYLLMEYSTTPHWSFTISDMYNIAPTKGIKNHYPVVSASYVHESNRFSLSYIKQVEGVVCSGGICRFEPAFSGIRLNFQSTF
jgi:Family of unknown function (DUF6029)